MRYASGTAPEHRGPMTFVLCLLLTLTFSQMWVMPLTGPVVDPDALSGIRNIYLPFYGIAAVLALVHWRQVGAAALKLPLLWGVLGLIAASTLWSIDPEVTSRRAIAILFTTVAGTVIGATLDWLGIARVVALTTLISGLASVSMAIFNPAWGVMHDLFPGAWQGVWDSKNLLGEQMSSGFAFSLGAATLDERFRRYWIVAATLALFLIVMSTSKTAIAAAFLAVVAMVFVRLVQHRPATAFVATWAAGSAIIVLIVAVLVSPDSVLFVLGRDATLSGRTRLWAAALHQVNSHPWTGFGYGAVWGDKSPWGPISWITKEAGFKNTGADNSWIEIVLGIGYGGVVAFAGILAMAWYRVVLASFNHRGGYVALPFMLVFTLTTLTESIALIYNALAWVMFTAVAVRLSLGENHPLDADP